MKNSYILLRNNRESVPLYIEDLLKIGLKPSDLIWVECQSVGWRSPEEIAELKALLPENNNQDIKINNDVLVEDIPVSPAPMPSTTIEKKTVFVEITPGQDPTVNETSKHLADSLYINMKKYGDPVNSTHSVFDNKEIELKTNYSRPLDEIKEMYVRNLEKKEQRGKSIIKIHIPAPIKKIALYTGLISAGALMMLLIKNTGSKDIRAAQPGKKQADTVIITTAAQPIELKQEIAAATETHEKQAYTPEEQKMPVAINKKMPLKINSEKTEDPEINKVEAEINTKPDNEIRTVKKVTTENISSKLALKANDYNVGSFGGIRNLEMTLQNDSKYFLDRVTVEINYLNPEDIILKTDNIFFQSIQPGDASTIPVNKTKRGVKVNYKITKIESKELAAGTPKMKDPDNYTSN